MHTNRSKLRNVTLSAQGELIDLARKAAAMRGLTLNDAFRAWIESYSKRPAGGVEEPYIVFVASLGGIDIGPIPDRGERNRRNA